jgi:hypothetical protein
VKEKGQGRPDQKPTTQNDHLKEQGKPSLGFHAPQTEQPPRGGGSKTPERQLLPGVWDVMERMVRLDAPDVEDRPRWGSQEYKRELHELNRLEKELTERGTTREKLIIGLFNSISVQPGEYGPTGRDLSLEEFQQFRSRVEPLCEKEIAEEIHKQEEEKQRKIEEACKSGKILTLDLPSLAHYTPHLPYAPSPEYLANLGKFLNPDKDEDE